MYLDGIGSLPHSDPLKGIDVSVLGISLVFGKMDCFMVHGIEPDNRC